MLYRNFNEIDDELDEIYVSLDALRRELKRLLSCPHPFIPMGKDELWCFVCGKADEHRIHRKVKRDK